MCMNALLACMYVPLTYPVPEDIRRRSGTGAMGSCESLYWSWELNPSPRQEQAILTTEPSPASLL